MISLAVFTDEVSQDPDVAIRLAKEFDLEGVEIRSVWEKPPHKLDIGDIERLKNKLDAAGLRVFGISAPFFKSDIGSDKAYREHLDILRACIRLAKALDTNLVRVFAFWKQDPLEAYWDKMLERYQEPVRIAQAEGVILGLENEASTMIGTGLETRRFVDALGASVVKPLWDPSNELFADDGQTPYPDGYEHVKKDMVHFHIKDAVKNSPEGPVCVPMLEGDIDYRGQFSALVQDGYTGCIALETHWRPKPEQIEKTLLDRPGGSQFSELGEEASRICLQHTIPLLRELGIR
ncbi:MAG: sugar phosphate isomerase/epimerase [candidate division Zixibacteria bacterium]|nr:sugar phosphate isomerase/epimerase [candidate division Zixibacteria bacterium]